jgi:iron complex outermembrane recepter protein
LGTFPANSTRGEAAVDEIYGELLLPLVSGKTGARHLNLELGYRYSDYELQGGIDTYKALIDWGITDTLRFRGGRQLATRAPNIAEMFQAQSQTWSAASPGDPCGLNTTARYGANPVANPNAAQARALCSQIMGSVGATIFYDPSTVQPNGNSALWFVNAVGNPNVAPEEATTWTAGFVFQPSSDKPLLEGFTATVDFYEINIADMIAVEPGAAVYEACLSAASNPSFINAGDATVSGVDFAADWRPNLEIPGQLGINFLLTKLLDLETQATATSPTVDWVGTLGPDPGTSLNNGAFDYRIFTTVSYLIDDWSVSLRWRHLPTAEAAQEATVVGPVANLGAQDDYNVFDLSASWQVNDRTRLRMGIDNLLDTDPVITGGRNSLDPNPTSGQGTTEAGFYDILGRQVFVGIEANF